MGLRKGGRGKTTKGAERGMKASNPSMTASNPSMKATLYQPFMTRKPRPTEEAHPKKPSKNSDRP